MKEKKFEITIKKVKGKYKVINWVVPMSQSSLTRVINFMVFERLDIYQIAPAHKESMMLELLNIINKLFITQKKLGK